MRRRFAFCLAALWAAPRLAVAASDAPAPETTRPLGVTVQIRESADAPGRDDPFGRAVRALAASPELGQALASRALVAYAPMPPFLDAKPSVVLVGLWPGEGSGAPHEIVGVDLAEEGRLVRFAGGAPPGARALAERCGPTEAAQPRTLRGAIGRAEVTVARDGEELWRFLLVRPAGSSGTRGSGVELRDVRYRGKLVLKEAHSPILNVKYRSDFCGPFRDDVWQESYFDAPGRDLAPGVRLASAAPRTLLDTGDDEGGFAGVAIWPQPDRVVLVSEVRAGWYRYALEWRLLADGTIQPRVGFGAVANSCTCKSHEHHAYLRLHFALVAPRRSYALESGGSGFTRVTAEAKGTRAAGAEWRVASPLTGEAYRIVPGPHDGTADDYARGDVWLLRARDGETDDGERCSACGSTHAQLDRFLGAESLEDEGLVVWYALHTLHDGRDDVEVTAGPDLVPESLRPGTDWPQFGFDPARSGANPAESALGETSLRRLRPLFRVSLGEAIAGAPVLARGVAAGGATRDVLVVATTAGRVVALDAATGASLWSRPSDAPACRVHGAAPACTTNASPAIDTARGLVYAYGLDGLVHRLSLADGAERSGDGWPRRVTFKPQDEKSASPLGLVPSESGAPLLTVAHGAYPGDQGDYQGHVSIVDTASGAERFFNAPCSAQASLVPQGGGGCGARLSGIWSRGGAVWDEATRRLFVATGNGDFDPAAGRWGDSVLALDPLGSGNPLDSFTPPNEQVLDQTDADLGSASPALLGDRQTGLLVLQASKDGVLRLLDRTNLSSQGARGRLGGAVQELPAPGAVGVYTQPAVTRDARGTWWAYVANGAAIEAFRLEADGGPRLVSAWKRTPGGTSPVVANGLVWLLSAGSIRALRAADGAELARFDAGPVHWQSPIVVNGTVYFGDQSGQVTALGLASPVLPDGVGQGEGPLR